MSTREPHCRVARAWTLFPSAVFAWLALALACAGTVFAQPGGRTTLAGLVSSTHLHGIAVDRSDSRRLLVATHHGLYVLSPDLTAQRVSERGDDFMGFTPHPTDQAVLFASGHPALGGNLGFLRSDDAGKTWRQLSPGVAGPVDFHQMDVSKANPLVIYGNHGGLQVSRDGGRSWQRAGAPRDDVISLSASPQQADTVYIGTDKGLLRSTDGGKRWGPAHPSKTVVSMVRAGADGTLYAFLVGEGLARAKEADLRWEPVSGHASGFAIIHLAIDPANPQRMFAVRQGNSLAVSADGGRTWTPLGGR